MSYPFDQFTTLAGANQQLGLALAAVARAAMQRQFQAATQGLSAIAGQDGAGSALEGLTRILQATESNRQALLAESKAAFDDWRDSVSQTVSAEDVQQYFVNAMQAWKRLVPASAA